MNTQRNGSSVVLFANKTQNPKAPWMKGNVELTTDDLKWAVEQAKAKQPVKFRTSVWKRTSQSDGSVFLSGTVEPDVPFKGKDKGGDLTLENDITL